MGWGNYRFRGCKWNIRSSGILRSVNWELVAQLSGQLSVPSSRSKQLKKKFSGGMLDPWRVDQYVVPKRRLLTKNLRCVKSQTGEDNRHEIYEYRRSDSQNSRKAVSKSLHIISTFLASLGCIWPRRIPRSAIQHFGISQYTRMKFSSDLDMTGYRRYPKKFTESVWIL